MGYKNYVSVYCEGTKVVKNYNYEDEGHPFKNTTYGLNFQDNSFDTKVITVKISSCEDKIHYVYSNDNFNEINFQFRNWTFEEEPEEEPDQLFTFIAKQNLKIIFLENQYISDKDARGLYKIEYFSIDLKNGKDETDFVKKTFDSLEYKYFYNCCGGIRVW